MMREDYACDPSPSHIMELGIGYLWTGKYEAAWEHFQHAIKTSSLSISSFYGMAGVAKWCMDEPVVATEQWVAGLASGYADGGVGTHIPLLLLCASILRPGIYLRREAEQILAPKIEDARVKYWPGPLAMFVLNLIDESVLEERSVQGKDRKTPPSAKWLIAFYKRVLELERGRLNLQEFKGAMQRMADTSDPEWSDERTFLYLLWNEEFFIARYEACTPTAKLEMQPKT